MERDNSLSLSEASAESLHTLSINADGTVPSTKIQFQVSIVDRDSSEKNGDVVEEKDVFDLITPSESGSDLPTRATRRNTFPVLRDQDEKRRNPRLYGWRATVLTCAFTVIVVLMINVSLAVYGVVKYSKKGSERNLYVGDCDQAGNISNSLHILINILSTILLSASNYTMQCLHSPTRAEVDRAHAAKKWVDIGIPSWRNRKFVSLRNRVLWWGLGLSSLPLHFVIYNSSVFLEIAAQEYQAVVTSSGIPQMIHNNQLLDISNNCTELAWENCESIYSGFRHEDGDVIFTASALFNLDFTVPANTSSPIWDQTFLSLRNMSSLSWNFSDPNGMLPYGNLTIADTSYNITSCCAKTTVYSPCKLIFDVQIIVIVIICNAIKAICDALASFLEHPDPTTKDMCLISKREIIAKSFETQPKPKKWKEGRESMAEKEFYAVSARRWAWVNTFLVLCLFSLLIGLGQAADRNLQGTPSSTANGFGSTLRSSYPTTLTTNIAGWGKATTLVLVNTPQVLISLMSVLYNGCLTSMILVGKWNSFSQHRHPLHVTVPLGEQKSQYYLTIPYRYAIPLLIVMGTFHWLISESFFLVSLTAFRGTEVQPQDSVFGIGYSAMSIALAALICLLLIAVLALKSWQRYKVAMPVAGSCSVVISAACHKAERE
ncbi:hypothetical protein N431DRAFT_459996 [Stipitochalara longipes BDJ]|nr:hypothetical protein N431DRAFT_459996 [Stipitochalara longipes BDJ]